jgi:hypothetical protein
MFDSFITDNSSRIEMVLTSFKTSSSIGKDSWKTFSLLDWCVWSSIAFENCQLGALHAAHVLRLSYIVDGPFSKQTHTLPASMAGHPERPYHALVAGAVGGYFVWGRYSSVNHQIVLYLTSRVIVGLAKHTLEKYRGVSHHDSPSVLNHPRTYPLLAASVWGLVMVLFEESPHVLHKSLKQSMDEIYRFRLSSMVSSVDTSSEGSRS